MNFSVEQIHQLSDVGFGLELVFQVLLNGNESFLQRFIRKTLFESNPAQSFVFVCTQF